MGILEDDRIARDRIVSETKTNFFVEAGAGSGKTTMLVNRMVALVESGEVPIDKICAITFTKAAAGEFYERFQKLLIERSDPKHKWKNKGGAGELPQPTEKTRDLCRKALQDIDLCFMGTIDSFCNMVLSEHPSEAGILSDSTIVTDAETEVLYKQIYVKICNGECGKDLQEMADLFRSVNYAPEGVFLAGMRALMGKRNVHFNLPNDSSIDIDAIYADTRNELIKLVSFLKDNRYDLMYTNNAPSKEAWNDINGIYLSVSRKWSDNLSNVIHNLEKLCDIRIIPEAMDIHGPNLRPYFDYGGKKNGWLECDKGPLKVLINEFESLKYDISMPFLLACVNTVSRAMHDSGYLTFFDYLYYLREMLRKDAEGDGNLIRYIYNRHSYFLIDEFQDTDPLQAEIFFYLASENPTGKWYECKPRPGSLFIVGDPKQSIYRFRSADISSYLRVMNLFPEEEQLKLAQNFRSKDELIKYYNKVFSDLLEEDTENHDQSGFTEIPIPSHEHDDGEIEGVFRYHLDQKSDDPEKLANMVMQLVNNEKYKIRVKDEDDTEDEGKTILRRIKFSDIMIITYTKTPLASIMQAFDQKRIPLKVEGQVLFGSNEAFMEMYAIYAAVADDDASAVYSALMGKVFGLTKEDIMVYSSCGGSLSLRDSFDTSACTDETALKVADCIKTLKDIHAKSRGMSASALLAYILDERRIYTCVMPANLEVVYYALELVRNAEKSGIITSLPDGRVFLDGLLSPVTDVERCLSLSDNEDCVRMANLHKVKGLEAPIIILAQAEKSDRVPAVRVEHNGDSAEGYLFKLQARGTGFSYDILATHGFDNNKLLEETDSQGAEEVRKVYVAATRARNVLIVCSFGDSNVWDMLKLEEMKEYEERVDCVPSVVPPPATEATTDELYDQAEKECVLKNESRASAEGCSYSVSTPSKPKSISKLAEPEIEVPDVDDDDVEDIEDEDEEFESIDTEEVIGGAEDEAAELRAFADIMGTMVHKFMEVLVSSKGRIDCNNVIKEIISEHRTAAMIPYEAKVTASLKKIAATITGGGYPQPNGLPQDILKTLLAAEDVRCEVPFCYRDETPEGTVIWNGIIDVMYCEGGKWHIVDYKTNADGEDLDTKYQNQLSAYVKAFKETTGNDADARIYHIEL